MADSLGPPPAGGDVSRAPTLLGVYGTLSGICVLCTVARLYARFRLLRTIGVDDIVIIVSTVGDFVGLPHIEIPRWILTTSMIVSVLS